MLLETVIFVYSGGKLFTEYSTKPPPQTPKIKYLIEEEYPSGRKVRNDFDDNAELSRIHGQTNASAAQRTYANSFKYTPDGRIERLKLGNGLWEKAAFNDRLQVTELGLGNGVANLNLWKLNYGYDEDIGGGTANTGNLVSQTITAEGLANPFAQIKLQTTVFCF